MQLFLNVYKRTIFYYYFLVDTISIIEYQLPK